MSNYNILIMLMI